ncbi:MAG: zf-HC2 domain-containing protein [Rhodothermales bacterium]
MKHCPTYEPLMTEMFFGTLSEEDRERLDAHLASCSGCQAMVHEMEATLQVADAGTRPEPPEAFWDGYYERLVARMHEETHRANRAQRLNEWLRDMGRLNVAALGLTPRRIFQLSGAVALIAVGVLIGWLVFGSSSSPVPGVAHDPSVEEVPVRAASLEARTDRYLERSKVLLLGLVNMEPERDGVVLNLSRKQEVARELIEESSTLKAALSDEDQRMLRLLIEDLEVILLQIANLETRYDLSAIELVQRGVDRRAILLKINITEMRRADNPLQPAVESTLPDR